MRYLTSSIVAACAIASSAPAAAQTTLTATFSRGAVAEYSNGPNGTDNGALFSSLNISSITISQLSANGSWGGTQGNDTSVTAKITYTSGSTVSFPAAINWVKNAGGGQFDWVGLTIGAGTTVADGYNLTPGKDKTYILQFAQSPLDLATLLPNDLDGSANAGAALDALNLYFPTAVAAPPVITGPSGGAGATTSALSVNENQTAVTTLTTNKSVSWAITGGTDGSKFSISSGGVISFLTAPDFEVPTDSDTNNSYVLTVEATDTNGSKSTQTITVTVLNLDDTAPAVAANQSLSYPENQAANAVVGTIAATDDTGVTSFRFTATGTQTSADGFYTIDNAGMVRITAAGVAAGTSTNDFEITPNSFVYGVQARDAAANWSVSENVTFNVTDADDSVPTLTPNQAFSYAENQATGAVLGTVAATDDTAVTGFRFAATGTGTSADGYFAIDASGRITLTAAGAAAGAASNDFEITPNAFPYWIEAGDAAGNWSAPTNVTLSVTDTAEFLNVAPAIAAGQTLGYGENQTANGIIGTVVATDDAGVTAFRFAATSTQTSADGFYVIDNGGVVRITAAGVAAGLANNDFEIAPNSFTYAIEAGDAAGSWSPATNVVLEVTDLPDTPPVINGPGGSTGASSSVNVPEGTTDVTQVTANVPISQWTIVGGNDQGRFAIDAQGRITFVASPDYEAPADSDTNNVYVLVIEATDANGNKSAQTVTVNVTDRPDAPPVISGPSGSGATSAVSVPEGTTAVTQVTANVPISQWRIVGGNDQGRFTIDAQGNINFVTSPDYEVPTDSDTNNSYVLVIEATDANGNKSTQTVTVSVTNLADTPPAIMGPSGGAGALASAVEVPEGTTAVTTLSANRPVTWSIAGGSDRGQFSIDAAGQISFIAAPDFEAPTDSDRNNSYVLIVEAVDANGERSQQTITVTVLNVDELQRKLNEIGGNLRADLRNQAFSSLSAMLSFNEGLLELDNGCSSAGARRPVSGGVNANERSQEANVRYARDLSSCESRTRVFVDGSAGLSRVDGNWTTRALASARVEQRVGRNSVVGAALIGTAASDELGSFSSSQVSDRSLQLNVYGRTQLTSSLRAAAFAGRGKAWYSFRLGDGGFDLDGEIEGKRHLYGAALSGDIRVGDFTITTDAILSRAVEKLGSASLDASFAGEDRSEIFFRLGKVDITRLSVPVHLPIILDTPEDGREATRLDLSPGVICQDTAQDSSALDCGYQLGLKFRLAPSVRSLLRAEVRTESVDGYLLNSLTVGFQRRFETAERLAWGVDLSRQASATRSDNRAMLRVGIDR